MKKLLFILALLSAPLARGQATYPTGYSNGGNITATNAACVPGACVGIGLPTPSASIITVGVTGTFSATLAVEESQDGGTTFTSAGTSLTSTGTTSYVIAGFTQFRVRASAFVSGNAGISLQVSNAGGTVSGTGTANTVAKWTSSTGIGNSTITDGGAGVQVGSPTGGAEGSGTLNAGGLFVNGVAVGTGSGTVTSVSFTGGLISVATPTTTPAFTVAGTSGGVPYFSGAATWASSTAGTVNTLMKWGGAGNPPIASSITDNGTTVAFTLPQTQSAAIAASTPIALFNAAVTTGLTGTTNQPFLLRNATGNSNPSTWSTGDIFIGHNAAASNCSSFLEQHLNGGGINFRVDCSGGVTATGITNTGGTSTSKLSTAANCGAVGSAANPSLVACTTASAGAFSCATNASGGTCVVSTTAVSANSEIIVNQVVDEGTRLGVTCNTANVLGTGPFVTSKSAGTSFTITLGTVTTNPACFDYMVIN